MTPFLYYFLIWPVSKLPFPVLYFFSDVLYVVIYKLIGYRKEVVTTNLRNSFPEKPEKWIIDIREKFYHHLCDLILESFKLFTIPEKEALEHMTVTNGDVPDSFFEKGRDLIVVAGHYSNWEYAVITHSFIKHRITAAYAPIKNKFFENKMKKSRSRFGVYLFPNNKMMEYFEINHKAPVLTTFIADQSPRDHVQSYWTTFLNQETGVLMGAERFSKQYNISVIFAGIHRLRRGYYELYYERLIDEPSKTCEGEITEAYIRRLEQQIMEQPENWLWSHKRWKRKKPAGLKIPGIYKPDKSPKLQDNHQFAD